MYICTSAGKHAQYSECREVECRSYRSLSVSSVFQVLELTAKYCKDHDISFPNVDFTCLEKEPQREAYVLEDKENPKAPIVVHFPLVNVTYKDFKEPGMLITMWLNLTAQTYF